jgi:peptidoglycan/LPS O-acetylase OafA/YrhL
MTTRLSSIYKEKSCLGTQAGMSTSPVKRFDVLDSWRGICAAAIVLYHFPPVFLLSNLAVIRSGWLFVDFFFVLSGFVTMHTYGTQIVSFGSASRFVRRRFFRLYPMHFCTFAAFFALMVIVDTARLIGSMRFPEVIHASNTFSDLSFEKIGSHLTLLQGFVGNSDDIGFNIPSWAISVEFWTYILFAMSCLVLGRRLFLGELVLTVTCLLLLFTLSGTELEWYGNMLRCIAGFSLGSAAYLLLTRLNAYKCNALSKAWQPNVLIMTVLEVVVVVETLLFVWLASQRTKTDHTIHDLQWLSPIVFAQVIAVFSFEVGMISRALKRGILRRAGTYSYSIYMVHPFILTVMLVFLVGVMRVGGFNPAISGTAGTAILLLFLAILWTFAKWTYNRIERPGQTGLPQLLARFGGLATKSPG